MIFWEEGKVTFYSFNPPFEVKDHFKLQPKFVLNNNNITAGDINSVILNKNGRLLFYFVLDAEEGIEEKESNGTVYKNKVFSLYLHRFYESDKHDFSDRYLSLLKVIPDKSSFINHSLIPEGLRFRPFATVISLGKPVLSKYKDAKPEAAINDTLGFATWIEKTHHMPILVERESRLLQTFQKLDELNNKRLEFVSEEIGTQSLRTVLSKMITRSLDKNKVELKSPHQIVFPGNELTDEKEKLKVIKGIEYCFEELGEQTYCVFNNTNFLRSNDSLSRLRVQEPIDHYKHQFVNIRNGKKLPKNIQRVGDVNHSDHYYETFSTTDAYEIDGGSGFSEKSFYFQQTNLEQTVSLIEKFKQSFTVLFKLIDFDQLGCIDWSYRIIPRKKKFVFREGEVYHNASKGLYHVGVLETPHELKLQLLISKKTFELAGEWKIIEKINEAISFLYKDGAPPIPREDILFYDYNAFSHSSFSSQLDKSKCVITYLVNPSESKHRLSQEQKEKVNGINQQILEVVRSMSGGFVVIGGIDKYIFANAILKLGLRKGAIPWKLDRIHENDKGHIFIGIDLGHNHKDRKTNLTITAINNEGCLIGSVTEKDLVLKEQLSTPLTRKVFKRLFAKIKRNGIQNITIHRDGRFAESVQEFVDAIRDANGNSSLNIDIAEVIKNEVPLLGFKSNEGLLEGFEGLYFFKDKTAFLITNDQSLATNTSPKPLKIRKVWGNKSIQKLTEEIFWLTKPYSVNLFIPSKLPLTTLLANNRAYSRDLLHFISS